MFKEKTTENPFYGKDLLFKLFNTKGSILDLLSKVWDNCKEEIDKLMFHIICFNKGDIVNRHHNIFGKSKVQQGGQSLNPQWIEYLTWLIRNDKKQFIHFLPLIVEFVGLRELVLYQVRTKKKSNKITGNWGLLYEIQNSRKCYKALLDLLVSYINSDNPIKRQLVAKWISIPRFSTRQKKDKSGKISRRSLQKETVEKMKLYENLLVDLSERMDWVILEYPNNKNFKGFINWRKEYSGDLEYVLFSTGKIHEFDQEEFMTWLNILPSGGRNRVKRRLQDKDGTLKKKEYSKLLKWYKAWESYKLNAQKEQRKLEVKISRGGGTIADKAKLASIKKEAKVTTGAKSLAEYINDFLNGRTDKVTIDSIINKTNFEVPLLFAIDTSGSMGQNKGKAINMARLMLSLGMYKNPEPEKTLDFFISFNKHGYIFAEGEGPFTKYIRKNRFTTAIPTKVNTLVNRKESFIDNYNRISQIVPNPGGGTNVSAIFTSLNDWVKKSDNDIERAYKIEKINQYPIVMIISDGDFNNMGSADKSLRNLQMNFKQNFGWQPIIVVWDVDMSKNEDLKFKDLNNVIHIRGTELNTINQVFTKLTDMDVVDIYSSLNSLYKSNRYNLIKEASRI